MSIFEYDKEKEEKKLRKAEYEGGYDSGYNSGYEEGAQSGLDLGIIQGETKAKKEIARSFYEMGMPVSEIAKGIKISEETIIKWLNKEIPV